MEIKDLQVNQGNVELVAEIVEKGDVREFNKFGQPGKVVTATLKDASGTVKLSLWNEQIEQVKVGDKIHIINGWVGEWQGEKQLTTGKFGQLNIIEEGNRTESKEEKKESPDDKEIKSADDDKSEDKPLHGDEQLDEDVIKDEEEIK